MALNIQLLNQGFGSYLKNILPEDVATAAGAFAVAMRQVKNIDTVPIEKFSQVVSNIESTKNLDQVNGTNVPVSVGLADTGTELIALGDGPYNTYTMSNILGAMSGLPYPWAKIENSIQDLQTSFLSSIYKELFLAVEWEGATASVQYTTGSEVDYIDPGPPSVTYYKWYWQITGITLTDAGGGYSRGGGPTPTVAITGGSGATAVTTIDTSDSNAGSNGSGTFGRVTSITLTNYGSKVYYASGQLSSSPGPVSSPPLAQIQCPPTATLPAVSTGGTNTSYGTSGWPTMNSVVQAYIDQANTEIAAIATRNPVGTEALNDYYDQTGTALTLEQRARQVCYDPVPVPKNATLSKFPTTLYTFIDGVPTYSINTAPHMYAQTLEAISDTTLIGGQSIVAMMRQERNQVRLIEAGIPLDNNISGELDPISTKILIANGRVTTSSGTTPLSNMYPAPNPIGTYDIDTDNYYIDDNTVLVGTNTEGGNIVPAGGTSTTSQLLVPQLLSKGAAEEPGSLAGSTYQNLLPPQLNTAYTSDILPSSVYSVAEAIDQVIKCNCDCWID